MHISRNREKNSRSVPVWAVGFTAGVLFLAMGAVRGEYGVIFRKAVMICLECIGIG